MAPTRKTAEPRRRALAGWRATLWLGIAVAAVGCVPADPEQAPGPVGEDAPLVPADAAALAAYLKPAISQNPDVGRIYLMDDPSGAPPPLSPSSPSGDESTPFSSTALQTDGVDEADLVKFDGETLFVARQPTSVYVPRSVVDGSGVDGSVLEPLPAEPACDVEPCPRAGTAVFVLPGEWETVPGEIGVYAATTDPAEADEIATIPLPDAGTIHGMMWLPGRDAEPDRLVVVTLSPWGWGGPLPVVELTRPIAYGEGHVRVWIFDVDDPAEPELTHRSRFEGNLVAVRRVGDDLVLVTRTTPYLRLPPAPLEEGVDPRIADLDVEAMLPRRFDEPLDGRATERALVRPERCFVPNETTAFETRPYFHHPTLVSITMLDLNAPEAHRSVCAAGRVDRIFSSTRALYLATTYWADTSQTVVHKFAYTERGPAFRGSGVADGRPAGTDPAFGMGEVGDAFGVVTAIEERLPSGAIDLAPRLTLFAERGGEPLGLEALSTLPNEREPDRIGKPGEQLYGVRFVGDRIYAVTFRRIDPLYVLDVSDPRAPFIAGELEIPGFSDRLEAITPDLLLGVGMDSVAVGGQDLFQGVKVELFDVSDPSAPTSLDALWVGRRGSDTPVRRDLHALTRLDMGDGTTRIALPIELAAGGIPADEPSTWHPWQSTGLHLFEVDHTARTLEAVGAMIVADATEEDPYAPAWRDRSRMQGNAVHYVHGERVWSAAWDEPGDIVGPQ